MEDKREGGKRTLAWLRLGAQHKEGLAQGTTHFKRRLNRNKSDDGQGATQSRIISVWAEWAVWITELIGPLECKIDAPDNKLILQIPSLQYV